MDSLPRNFTTEFATELSELSQSFGEIAQALQTLQQMLQQGDEQAKQILDTLPTPIIVVEPPSGHVFYVNQKAREILTDDGVVNLALDEYPIYVSNTGELCPVEQRPLRRSLKGETVYEDRLEWHVNERIIPLEIWTRPIYDHNGNLLFAISVFQDSTQRKQAEKSLAEMLVKQTELEAAHDIQTGLYPQYIPSLKGFDMAAYCCPSLAVGGDLYDYYLLDSGNLVITLADVMGKGIYAALLTVSFRASLQVASQNLSPGETMAITATAMADDLEQAESYITCVHCQLNVKEKRLTYVNAGHGHGFMLRSDGSVETLAKGSPPISPLFALISESNNTGFKEHEFLFSSGDILILYSDGLIDCKPELNLNPNKIADLIQDCSSASAIVERLSKLSQSQQDALDDLTLIVLRCV